MKQLLTGVVATGVGGTYNVQAEYRRRVRAVKVNIVGGTGSVALEGSMGGNDAQWVSLGTFAATGLQFLQLPPVIRFNVTARGAGATIDAYVDALG
jgi:hypothetical protein